MPALIRFATAGVVLVIFTAMANAEDTAETLRARAKAVLAQVEGQIKAPGLKAPVEVRRDRWGVPHIYAQNQHDLFFAQGYVAAQDRLFQIDLWRRVGVGQTAEIFGEEGVEADRFARLVLYRGELEPEWKSYAPDTQEIATAFTDGINACIDQMQAQNKLPIEFQLLGYQPQKWQPEDVLARMSGIIMTSNWQREVARAHLISRVGVERAREIAPTDPPREFAPAPGLDLAAITPDIFQGYLAAARTLKFSPVTTESNNWAIDGTLSASGKPLLASDPHRPLGLPSLRYVVHLHAPGWNAIGAGEPGLPGIALGHNERIAWGITIVGTDQADLYVEETKPDDPRQYKVGDSWQPMRIIRETIRVRGRTEPLELELRFTRHGPVIYQDESRGTAIALQWAGSEPGGAAYLGGIAVARAQNHEQFLKALEGWHIPCLNFMYADVEGNIGWVAAAHTPIRKNWDGLLPVPGASGDYEWQGFLPVSKLPQAFNPPQHWLATANHNILPPGYPHQIAYEWAGPQRFQRVQTRLTEKKQFTLDDFQSIQHDSRSIPGLALAELAKHLDLPADLHPYRSILTGWDGVLSRDAQAGPLYAAWLQELLNAFYAESIPKDPRLERADLRNVTTMLGQLQGRDELLRTTFAAAVSRVKQLQGNDPAQWRWGKLHTASFTHAIAGLGPAYEQVFNLGPVERTGDGHTPNNSRHDDSFQQVHGASYRQLFDLADWDRGLATSTPGQSGQLGSPHYSDLLPLWAEGQYFPLAYSRAKVEAVTQYRLELQP
ncbi:MAG TPA: penicillin acylase family protein [Pirellulaceae bacterium]|nr:penicillin acylase family protein [Pirellulaceae bacterium]